MKYFCLLLFCLFLLSCQTSKKMKVNETISFFTGSYTRAEGHVEGKSKGIEYLKLNPIKGTIAEQILAKEVINPSFMTISREGKHLYAVSELAQMGESTGFIYAYEINEDKSLNEIGKYSTNGRAPCHVVMDQSERLVFVSNYLDATVTVYIRDENGFLKETQILHFTGSSKTSRQEAPHLHSVKISSDNQRAFMADLGSDKVWIYDINTDTGQVRPSSPPYVEMPAGSGPRHLAIAKKGLFYVINELNSTVSVVKEESDKFQIIQSLSTLPSGFSVDNSCADLHLHPSGKFLYGSNRGHNSIVAYSIDQKGKISAIGHFPTQGEIPRNFNITSDGQWMIVANQNSDNLTLFSIDQNTGKLTFKSIIEGVPTPVCVTWD